MTVSLSFLVKLSSFTSSSEDMEYKYFILGGSGGSGHIRSTSFCGVPQPANKAMAEAATKIPPIPILFIRVVRIVTGCALYLISCKGLDPIGKRPSAILGWYGRLIKTRVYIVRGKAHGYRVIICQIRLQILQCCIMGPGKAAVCT